MPNETAKIFVQWLGDLHVDPLAGPEPHDLEHEQPRGEPDGERRKDDVERNGEGELDARQQKRIEVEHGFAPSFTRVL